MSDKGNVPVADLPAPPVFTICSRVAPGAGIARIAAAAPSSGANPFTANDMIAFPFVLGSPATIRKAFWSNGTSAGGNYATAIYDADFNKLVQSASTGGSGASAPQVVTMAAKLPAGLYYCALASDSATTNRLMRFSIATTGASFWKLFGCWRQASVTLATLPNPATPVAYANIAFPVYGLISRSVFDV